MTAFTYSLSALSG